MPLNDEPGRCAWAETGNELMRSYHDEEWGVPCHDDNVHFEFLVLESAQAGLSWATILSRREDYRRVFDGFDPARVARFDESRISAVLSDHGIIRNEAKVRAAVGNARAFLGIVEDFGSFDSYIWSFVDGEPVLNEIVSAEDVPAETPLSRTIAAELKGRGFTFIGPVIIYSYMQAMGLVNDHELSCFRSPFRKGSMGRRPGPSHLP